MSQEKTTEPSLPLHRRIALSIRQDIAQKELAPHTRIPSEVALASQYNVSHGTITKALEWLVREGILYRRRPQGTFVAPSPDQQPTRTVSEQPAPYADPASGQAGPYTGVPTRISSTVTPLFIGMLVPYMADSFLHHSVLGVETMTRAAGFGLSFACSENDWALERYHIEQFLRQGVAGVIIHLADQHTVCQQPDGHLVSVHDQDHLEMLYMLQERNVPFVLLDRYIPEIECNYVTSDDFSAGYATTQHLLSLGHRRVGFMTITQQVTSCVHRYHGYRQCLLDHHLPFDETLLLDTLSQMHDFSSSAPILSHSPGQDDLTRVCDYLSQPHRPTAVVAMNDYVALQVLQAAEYIQIAVPEELALVCCSSSDLDAYMRVPLTSIIQPMAEVGRQGAQILLDLIAHRFSGIRQIKLPVSLMVRRSSGADESKIALGQPSRDTQR
jgi:DNA-binding LacI/PurR family transcriptional regulator/DNA-binding transcriptional regulator YhcF (GntR family)